MARCGDVGIHARHRPDSPWCAPAPAGFALTGPGLTEDVDESALTTDALWKAVTGKPGTGWVESVKVVDRSQAAPKDRKVTPADATAGRERPTKAAPEPATDKQLKYLTTLVGKVGRERFDAAFNSVVQGTEIAPRGTDEKTGQALRRLTKAAARKLITPWSGPDPSLAATQNGGEGYSTLLCGW
ncbi:hypothetical protein ACQEVF_30865 [Nonomuraea polychroma]|uniref:hypothetical protein n=1 Tax=Nonomuraea polychroma TaxID=46176 RepID=UPI003D91B4C5